MEIGKPVICFSNTFTKMPIIEVINVLKAVEIRKVEIKGVLCILLKLKVNKLHFFGFFGKCHILLLSYFCPLGFKSGVHFCLSFLYIIIFSVLCKHRILYILRGIGIVAV